MTLSKAWAAFGGRTGMGRRGGRALAGFCRAVVMAVLVSCGAALAQEDCDDEEDSEDVCESGAGEAAPAPGGKGEAATPDQAEPVPAPNDADAAASPLPEEAEEGPPAHDERDELIATGGEKAAAAAGDGESARLYVTSAERRDTGRRYALTPWLSAVPLAEVEWQARRLSGANGVGPVRPRETTASLQLGLLASLGPSAHAEVVLDYDSAEDRVIVDEAFLGVAREAWELEAGRLFTPLGAYISHFVSGPLLEFAESRVDGVALAYAPADWLEFKLTTYRGKAWPAGGQRGADWAAALEVPAERGWSFGLSYQSDLADSQDKLLDDVGNRYRRRVGAAGGYAMWTTPEFTLSTEVIGALGSFRELTRDRDRPLAWNLEFAHSIHPRLDWALRWEGSRELADAPARQWGLALTWRPMEQASLTVECLRGWFSGSLASNARDEPYSRLRQLGAKLSLAF